MNCEDDMKNILIVTIPGDLHAIDVKLALEKLGDRVVVWYFSDFPALQKHSFAVEQKDICWEADGVDFAICNQRFDVVWFRRPQKPVLSKNIHPDDKKIALQENLLFYQMIWRIIAPEARWINPYSNAVAANNKLLQLKVAAQVGFKIPPTLITNDPSKIKAFINAHQSQEVIYKTFGQGGWFRKKSARLSYTRLIGLQDLPNDDFLQATPGIFQQKIPKSFELRVAMLGNYPVAVKILSQAHPKGMIDWRCIPTNELVIEQFELPSVIQDNCRFFMQRMGLVFGCFDFIVTPDNEYYFLEINEQGQFLWIEEINPEIKMLASFVNFLRYNSGIYATKDLVSLADFSAETLNQQRLAMKLHSNDL